MIKEGGVCLEIKEMMYSSYDKAPECCSYCFDKKDFLMIRPKAFSHKSKMIVHVNLTNEEKWICLDCLSVEIDTLGHSINIYEFDE